MMKKAILVLSFFGIYGASWAQTYTWAENTACIFYTNCTRCHYPGGPGPFSLIDYASAFSARFAIKQAVLDNYMPPWPPDENYQTYAHERLLTQTEKDIIVGWVDQGGQAGVLANAPAPPNYSATGSQLSQIDFTANIGNFTNPSTLDDYRCFVIPTSFGVDKYISEIELVPGNRQMVHHVLIFQDVASTCYSLDTATAELGYSNFGGTGSATSKLIGAYVPGAQPLIFPSGMGMKLDANAYIILQIHYPQGTDGDLDSSRINLKFSSGVVRQLTLSPILSHTTNISPPLVIPPNTAMTFTETYTIPSFTPGLDNVTVLSVAPHMHTVAQSIICYAIKPGNDTVPLISIPNWDFRWQGLYDFRQPLVLPEGTIIKAEAYFNNTSSNPNAPNPNNPVVAGESTSDEMMMVYFNYLPYQAGDENIIIDTSTVKPTYMGCNFVGIEDIDGHAVGLKVYPNPTKDFITVSFEQLNEGDVQLSIVDISGKIRVEYFQPQVGAGIFTKTLDLSSISGGIYYLRTWNGSQMYAQPVIIIK
jgi:hypothetical protein